MTKVGAIINPASQRNKGGLRQLKEALSGWPDLSQVILDDMADLAQALEDFARRETGLLLLCGGDGTVQAALTELYARRCDSYRPRLAVLARGMTNMIANDVGMSGSPGHAVGRLMTHLRERDRGAPAIKRRLLRMENAAGFPPQVGTFFGAAGIYRAIQLCRRSIYPMRIEGQVAAAITLGNILLKWLFTRGRKGDLFRGEDCDLAIDGEDLGTESYCVVMATTLDRLILNARPFWNQREGALRFTTVAYPPRRLSRSWIKVLYGSNDRNLPSDIYASRSADSVSLTLTSPFTLDGQLFEPDPGKPLILTARDRAVFVRP